MLTKKQPSTSKGTVVIIDDDSIILEVTTLILMKRGFKVFSASCAAAGLEFVAIHKPELVLLDYKMPQLDGLATLRKIKSSFPDTSVVMFTGNGSEEVAVELMKGGASEYILKPCNSRNLLDRLESVLKTREIELKNREFQLEHERLLKEIELLNRDLHKRVREKSDALQKAQNEIVQSEKLAALGFLTAGMSHEIRNPLNSISLYIQLMRQNTHDPEQLEYQGKILKEVERVDLIIRKLLDSSRQNRTYRSDVQINEVIDNALEAFSPQFEDRGIQVERRFLLIPSPIKGDHVELEQIFSNLFLNAMDEMIHGGSLVIELSEQEGVVVVKVADCGKGIPEHVLPNIFEPFFSTKTHGTGMGLPVVRRIARMYEGSIVVESSSPEGTVFRLEFPVCI